jgi:DNA (cytosine-5)-methyltransferase 1
MFLAADIFAGPGGFSEAVRMAGGRVVWAGNHDHAALAVHEANHPDCERAREDLRVVDWGLLPRVNVIVASPECKQHSTSSQPARSGSKGAGSRSRALAYEVVHAADALEPEAVVVENVDAFTRWRLFKNWLGAFADLGFHTQVTRQVASFHGVPQRRVRVFIVATRKPLSPFALNFEPKAEPGIGPAIEWEDGDWRPVRNAQPGARARMLAGRHLGPRYWAQNVTGHRGKSLSEPLSTVTCQDQHVVVDGDMYRTLTVRETARAMGFPDSYRLDMVPPTVAKSKLGDAVCPAVAAAVLGRVLEGIYA